MEFVEEIFPFLNYRRTQKKKEKDSLPVDSMLNYIFMLKYNLTFKNIKLMFLFMNLLITN